MAVYRTVVLVFNLPSFLKSNFFDIDKINCVILFQVRVDIEERIKEENLYLVNRRDVTRKQKLFTRA